MTQMLLRTAALGRMKETQFQLFLRIFPRMSGQNSFSSVDTVSHMTCVPQRVSVLVSVRSAAG